MAVLSLKNPTDSDARDARPERLLDKIPVSKMSNLSNVSISS